MARFPPAVPSEISYNALEVTGFQGPIFADPERNIYRILNMTAESLKSTPAGQAKKSYITGGTVTNALRSVWVSQRPTIFIPSPFEAKWMFSVDP